VRVRVCVRVSVRARVRVCVWVHAVSQTWLTSQLERHSCLSQRNGIREDEHDRLRGGVGIFFKVRQRPGRLEFMACDIQDGMNC